MILLFKYSVSSRNAIYIPTPCQGGTSAPSAVTKECVEFPVRLNRRWPKDKPFAQILPRARNLGRILILLTQYCMSTNSKSICTQRNHGDCPFTKLWCYMPSRFKAMEKPALLYNIHPEQGQGLVAKSWSPQGFFHAKIDYRFLFVR